MMIFKDEQKLCKVVKKSKSLEIGKVEDFVATGDFVESFKLMIESLKSVKKW